MSRRRRRVVQAPAGAEAVPEVGGRRGNGPGQRLEIHPEGYTIMNKSD